LRTDLRGTIRRRLALVLLALFVTGVTVARAAEPVGTVAELEGRAEVQHAGEAAWGPLAIGTPVLLGDHLRTLADGKLRVVLREDSALTLGPGSQLAITEQVVAPATVSRFQLLLGTIKAAVTERYAQPQARFEVETPTAIAGVRGTSFIAQYDPVADETLVVGVENVTRVRGRVEARGGEEVEVGPGQATWVRRGSRPVRPRMLPESRMRGLQGATQLAPGAGAGAGAGARQRANRLDARRPQRAGQRAFSTEERAVDQPPFNPRGPKPPPPPPPVRR
jgi:hypothetical protein